MQPPTTTHHHPQPAKIYPPAPTSTYQHPPPAKMYPPQPTTIHHLPKYIPHHPLPTTTSQNISITIPRLAKIYPPLPTTSQKVDHHPAKAKRYSYITSFWHCFNSFFFFEMQYSFQWRRFCVIKFWSIYFSNHNFLLQSMILKIL